jgi:hypothetical protein
MIKIKNLEKALNDIGIQTTLEQVECRYWDKTYRILELELKNTCDGDGEPYSFIFHPTTHRLITNVTQGEQIKSSKKIKK